MRALAHIAAMCLALWCCSLSVRANPDQPAYDQLDALTEIQGSLQAIAPVLDSARAVVRAESDAQRAEAFAAFNGLMRRARGVLSDARARLEAMPEIDGEGGHAPTFAVARQQREQTIASVAEFEAFLTRLERVVTTIAETGEATTEAAHDLGQGVLILLRSIAQQARLRALVTPEYPWTAPLEHANAELLEGVATATEIGFGMAAQPAEQRATLRERAQAIRGHVVEARHALAQTYEAETMVVLTMTRPGLDERMGLYEQAAIGLEQAAETTTDADVRVAATRLGQIVRQIGQSQREQH